jgi:CRISPR-associated endonuclease/helicase Cas3
VTELPSFDDFYRAVHDRDPFPWQSRLAALVTTSGWPSSIGVPTGLGKTATIDVAVWAAAAQADRPPSQRTVSTRTWYVVNRRLLVDAAYEHGCRLAELLATTKGPASVVAVGERLRSIGALGTEQGPLHVTRLRGGADLGTRTPDPSQPALIFATVDMFASRWLFSGYASSTSMRPIDAAHAGTDSLVLLDEAHLAPNLLGLGHPLAECDPGDPTRLLPSARARTRFVSLTATGDRTTAFDLGDEDRDHPVVAQRLRARKATRLVTATKSTLVRELTNGAAAALEAADVAAPAVLVFANQPRTAREVANGIHKIARGRTPAPEVLLLTGRTRDREADRLRARVLDPATGLAAGREPMPRERPLIVVATQTLEVGADLDADHLVTESAGVRALVQRLGRLNRLGRSQTASATIVHPTDRGDHPLYGTEPDHLWKRLTAAAAGRSALDLGPGSVTNVLGTPEDTPPPVGELLPPLLWEWVKTSIPVPGAAPVELFYEGLSPDRGSVALAWRADLPVPGERLVPPLRGSEAIELPIWEMRDVLGDDEPVHRLARDRARVEVVACEAVRPGDQVLLPVGSGRYGPDGWDPRASNAVLDVSALRGDLVLTRRTILGLVPGADAELLGLVDRLVGGGFAKDHELNADAVDVSDLATEVLAALRGAVPHPWITSDEWHTRLDELTSEVVLSVDGPALLRARSRPGRRHAVVRADAFDELSFGLDGARSPSLSAHLQSVGDAARAIAHALGLGEDIALAVERAARWHDLGKVDGRFQRWLDPDACANGPLAKSGMHSQRREAARRASGWPRGGRHETISQRLVAAHLDALGDGVPHRELIEHLVASHHGHGRPMVPVVDDPLALHTAVEIEGMRVVVSGDLSEVDWHQPARFRRLCEHYGYWGLALLETVVRQADHAASSAVDVEVA